MIKHLEMSHYEIGLYWHEFNKVWKKVILTVFILTVFIVLCLLACPVSGQQKLEGLSLKTDILIDVVHANDFSEIPITPDNYFYHHLYGFNKAFGYLKREGVRINTHRQGIITSEILAETKLLFINLPSAERPPFYVSEIKAITEYVQNGGSLFLITDHSNCYFHSHRLMPLLHEFDIKVPTWTLCEVSPKILGTGNSWFYVDHFEKHPVTQGLHHIAFQTSGVVDERYAIAWSSEKAWGDNFYIELYGESDIACYGNFKRDRDEPNGPFGTVLAKEFGKGRIVIVADQNLFSAFFLNYADNYKLWFNIFAWLLRNDHFLNADEILRQKGSYPVYEKKLEGDKSKTDPLLHSSTDFMKKNKELLFPSYIMKKSKRLFLVEDFTCPTFGSTHTFGYYNILTYLARRYDIICSDTVSIPCDLYLVANGGSFYQQETVSLLADLLKQGKTILFLDAKYQTDLRIKKLLQKILLSYDPQYPSENIFKDNDDYQLLVLPNGGRIVLLRNKDPYYNIAVTRPEGMNKTEEQEKLDLLLRTIETLMIKR